MFPKESPEDQSESIALCRKLGLQVIDPPENWASFFAGTNIQSVIIGLPHSSYRFLDHHLDQIANQVADVKIVPDILRFTQFAAGIEIIGETPVIHLHESPLSGFNCFVKRSVDIAGALMALLLFAPLMIMIALLVPFSSPGPIFYRQERMGLDGKRFQCLKFRTMPVDSEKETGAVWAKPGDQRATKLGSFLRRTSLDELPQLINVLRGDMSLVGPRPERPVFVNEFRGIVPGYMLRHKVKTGITGWAQVNGWRGSTSIHKRIECDLYYIQNWSIWLDFKILLMTIEEVLTGRNAY
jgi:Undecaprenyl-phosphate glucose phosphotransferase